MKIISITIQNLNSIRGKHTIDFESSFSKHALFLLTGDTGSGKTTVLDAISVALYGVTPRLKSKHELEQLISIGEKESLAEVEFMVERVLYRSRWSISVARTGTIKDSQRVLSRYNGADFEIITSSKKGFNNKIEEITNLNFDRFTKTAMLAQGSFDAFLQAEDSDKSDLLEKITGTQIYQKISQRVYEKNKEQSSVLTQLRAKVDESKVVKDEEIKEKTDSIDAAKKQSDELKKEIKKLQDMIKSAQNISKYQKDIESFTKKQSDLKLEKDEFKDDAIRLENSLKAKDIYTQTLQADSIFKELKEKNNTIKELNKTEDILLEGIKELKEKEQTSDKKLAKFQETKKRKQEAIDSAKELLLNQSHTKETLNKMTQELKQKESATSLHVEAHKDATNKKVKLEISSKEIDKVSLELKAQSNTLQISLKNSELEVSKIDKESLFKEKNRVENRLKDIELFMKLQSDRLKHSKILTESKLTKTNQEKMLDKQQKEKNSTIQKIERLEQLKLAALSIQNYDEARKNLKDGDECPLCGSHEHPWVIDMPKFDDRVSVDLVEFKSELKSVERMIKEHEKSMHKTDTAIEVANTTLQRLAESLKDLDLDESDKKDVIDKELKELKSVIQKNSLAEDSYKKITKELESSKQKEQKNRDKQLQNINDIKILTNNISNSTKQLNSLKVEVDSLKNDAKKLNTEISNITSNISILLNKKSIEESKEELENETTKLNYEQMSIKTSKEITDKKITINDTTIKNLQKSILDLNQKSKTVKEKIENLLVEKGFKSTKEAVENYIDDEQKIKKLQIAKKSLEDKSIEITTLLKSTKESLDIELKKESKATQSKEELSQKEKDLTLKRDDINRDATVLEEQLRQSKIIKNEQIKILKEIETQKTILLPWEILNNLIGSASGASYQKFVQNLTLGHLLNLANKHLRYLSDRYTLVKSNNDKLDISIIDGYFIDIKRGVKTLSGGERFLVSLSLALGLSDLVNDKIKVDSLFLDEGFGTLDEESLNIAIDALEKLHSKGKLIGIISHVALLKDRIYAQIQLKKKSGGGSDIVIIS